MRTREEQISHLACAIFNQNDNIEECLSLARTYILEAERRAEQRVRAEIARDSERLDWLSEAAKTGMRLIASEEEGGGIILDDDCLGDVTAPTLRDAIDAARESNND